MVVKIPIWILQSYDFTIPPAPKRSRSFKNLCDYLGLVKLYDFDDPKWSWFLVIFFNLIEDSVRVNEK